MYDWIAQLIAAAVGPVSAVATAAADRIASVYSAFTGALGRVRGQFARWVTTGARWESSAIRFASVTYTVLHWLYVSYVPASIRSAVDDVTTYVLRQVAALAARMEHSLASLQGWTLDLVSDARRALLQVINTALDQLASAVRRIDRVEDRVFGVLGSPERLAAWILAPLLALVLQWALDNAAWIAEQAWRNRRAWEGRLLQIIDDALGRIV